MQILVVGGGGREHALVWKIAQSPLVKKIYCAPGNPGIGELAECVDIPANDIHELKNFAIKKKIDLTVVGPEEPLVMGIVDTFTEAGLKVFGPSKEAAQIEGSKDFAKELMLKEGVPTGSYEKFTDKDKCIEFLETVSPPYVIKADGLAAGKGVVIAEDLEDAKNAVLNMLEKKQFGDAGSKVIVEQFLDGVEISILAFSDGENILPMVSAQDHKKVYNDDKGPNTGGMGAFSPSPYYDADLNNIVLEKVFKPIMEGFKKRNISYKGVLYAGLILTKEGPKVLEFNCRFGDPETQVVIKRMKSDLVEIMLAVVEGNLDKVNLEWHPEPAVCVVIASGGYPGDFEKGKVISGLQGLPRNSIAFHAGTSLNEKGEIVTSGGRVLGVTSSGEDLQKAAQNAYSAVEKIHFVNAHYRTDIALKKIVEK